MSRGSCDRAGKIRNIAVAGHRGVGKTSLVEALLFQAGKTNRLGTIERARPPRDWDDGEHKRADVALRLAAATSTGRTARSTSSTARATPAFKPTPSRRSASSRARSSSSARVMGVEVNTARVWKRADEYELSRVVFVNMLDRERADFFRVLEARARAALRPLRRDPAADRRRARGVAASSTCCTCARTSIRAAARRADRSRSRIELADAGAGVPREAARRRRRDERGPDGALPRRRGAAGRGRRATR